MLRSAGAALAAAILAAPAFAEPAGAPAARSAADAWLAEVDAGDYARAWSDADPLLQGAVSQGGLVASLSGVRAPLAALESRRLSGTKAASTLPGAPDGSYRVFTYAARFANKADAVETVVLRQEADGWKVSGYHLR